MWVAFALTFFQQKIQHICVSLDVNFNESLTNDIVSFEQLGPEILIGLKKCMSLKCMSLTKVLGKSDDKLVIFLLSQKNKALHFLQIVSCANNLK